MSPLVNVSPNPVLRIVSRVPPSNDVHLKEQARPPRRAWSPETAALYVAVSEDAGSSHSLPAGCRVSSGGASTLSPAVSSRFCLCSSPRLPCFDLSTSGHQVNGLSGCRLRHDCRFEATWLRQWREQQAELVQSQPGRNRYRCGHDDGLKKGDLSASDRHTMSWLRGRPRQASWRPKHRCFLSRFQEQPNLSTARDRGLQ